MKKHDVVNPIGGDLEASWHHSRWPRAPILTIGHNDYVHLLLLGHNFRKKKRTFWGILTDQGQLQCIHNAMNHVINGFSGGEIYVFRGELFVIGGRILGTWGRNVFEATVWIRLFWPWHSCSMAYHSRHWKCFAIRLNFESTNSAPYLKIYFELTWLFNIARF